jgi:acetolactate synthase-1/2/3 large subunit
MQHVIQKISELTKGKAVMVSDVGQHQMWMAQFYQYVYPRTHLTSGGLGTMGFSLPASVGAAFARKDFPIVSISGDGGIQMNIQELATIREYNVPVKIIILNNGYLGMVRQWQELFWRKRYSHVEMTGPDYVKVAEAYGIPGFRATLTNEIDDVIKQLFEVDGPALAEFKVVKEDNVYPMIPAGQTYHEIIDIPDEKPSPAEGEQAEDIELVTISKG